MNGGSLLFPLVGGEKRMSVEKPRRPADRRATDRRVADDPDYAGPERRQGDRRTGKDRRTPST